MKNVVLHDMNNLVMRVIHITQVKTVDKKTKKVIDVDWAYWKYIVFSSIYYSMIKNKATEVVLAVDDRHSWRYDIWSRYKEDRKKKKEKQDDGFPWDEFFIKYKEMMQEMKEHLPVKVMYVDKAEGDDIIGVIVKKVPESCTVISTDKDYMQLLEDTNRVKVYNPLKKQYMGHPNSEIFLIEQCLLGQKKDSIFNIKTPWLYPIGKRKPGFGPKALEKVLVHGWKDWLIENDLYHRYDFNRCLMDFDRIPSWLQDNIMDEYKNQGKYPHPDKIWKYIKVNNWPEFIDNFTAVEDRFMQCY